MWLACSVFRHAACCYLSFELAATPSVNQNMQYSFLPLTFPLSCSFSLFTSKTCPTNPQRLPSGAENPYFRAWALCGSEGSSSSGRGTAAYSNPPSSRSFASNVNGPGSRPKRSNRHKLHLETSATNPNIVYSPVTVHGGVDINSLNRHVDDQNVVEDPPSSLPFLEVKSFENPHSNPVCKSFSVLPTTAETPKPAILEKCRRLRARRWNGKGKRPDIGWKFE